LINSAIGNQEHIRTWNQVVSGLKGIPEVDSSCRLLIVPLFRGSSSFESLTSSHPGFSVKCECNGEEINDGDESLAHLLEFAFFLGLWRLGVALLEGSDFGVWGLGFVWGLEFGVEGFWVRVEG
jgi:hypothetical protein